MPHSRMRVPCIFQRVAIDDAGLTSQVVGCGGGRWRKDQRREHGYRCSGHPRSLLKSITKSILVSGEQLGTGGVNFT
jgi:hypothetical protein